MPKIVVHEKVLAHLSRGLYRSPASALRELVSNAWDANATKVLISTNYPGFMQISVHDNGDGFNKDDFKALMSGGIGNSAKRRDGQPLINDRPVIGRLGIGILGIAQICGSFFITSRPKRGQAFRAHVRLYDLIKERLDTDDPDIMHDDQASALRVIDVGQFDFVDVERDDLTRGTRITSDDVHPTFVKSFRDSLNAPSYIDPSLDWSTALGVISRVHSLQELGDYWKLLWELAACSPLPYVGPRAVPGGLVKTLHERLESYDFEVIVDGISLRKPVHLIGNPGGYTSVSIGPEDTRIYGKPLRYEGYVIVQEGSQLKPDELRGIMLRIKNIGIGYYDSSFLDYPFNEGPRAKWVTGELFVHTGLEDALNVDRDSFNRFHPEYRAIRDRLHEVLHKDVFPEVYKNIELRSKERTIRRERDRVIALESAIREVTKKKVTITAVRSRVEDPDSVGVAENTNQVRVSLPKYDVIQTKKTNRQLAASMLALFEVASRERGLERQRERFTKLLLALLSRW